jgi:hypothetical protein
MFGDVEQDQDPLQKHEGGPQDAEHHIEEVLAGCWG